MISRSKPSGHRPDRGSCNGDIRGALKALLLVNEQLEAELQQFYAAAARDDSNAAARSALIGLARLLLRWPSLLLRAGTDRRAGEPGVVLRIIGTGPEPDIAADLRVDDGIAGHDLAIRWWPDCPPPNSARRQDRPPRSRRSSRRPAAMISWFRSCSESRPTSARLRGRFPPAMNCRESWLTAVLLVEHDLIGKPYPLCAIAALRVRIMRIRYRGLRPFR